MAALVLAIAVVVGVSFYLYLHAQNEARDAFRYTAVLTPDGAGEARISLPMPLDPRMLSGIVISPASSSFVVNESGPEPALDVTFSGPTWVNVTGPITRNAGGSALVGLTRTAPLGQCFDNCTTEMALEILAGNLTVVQVELRASWDLDCDVPVFSFEGSVLPGVRGYAGHWLRAVC
ncbi:MAG TPA: hypothetical protein VGR51_05385 [Thermoplasmata archaeon]|nr:hypothetical protein [Thermoplasmata archaeon]